MGFASSLLSLSTLATLAGLALAHSHPPPGSSEFIKHANFQNAARRSLSGCQAQLRKRGGVYDQAKARRMTFATNARRSQGFESRLDAPFKRDLDTVLNTSHHSNLTGVTNDTDAATLFNDQSSCVLAPEVTQGPYYVDAEYVRWDIREDQEGVDIYVDVQLIDINTCEPVPDVYIDFWHTNATGVYSGVVANGNGDSDNDSNLNTTFLRGIQKTDSSGVAQWLSLFPGHYTGRTPHIHIIAHQNEILADNGTLTSTTVSHVGQLFFDQDLITSVEEINPYSSNTQNLTANEDDGILAEEASDIDPVMAYVLLGDSVGDGLMMWASVGINATAEYTVSSAATLTEDGGVANDSSGGGPPGGSPQSGMPSGLPSGSMELPTSTQVSSSLSSPTASDSAIIACELHSEDE